MPSLEAPKQSLEAELVSLLDEGIIFDRSEKPIRPVVTLVGTQRASQELLALAEDFLTELLQRYPKAKLVVGNTSNIEQYVASLAGSWGVPCEIVEKANKGEWDEGSVIRDERVVGKASNVIALDESARSKSYQVFAKRMGKRFSQIGNQTKQEGDDE